MKKKVKKLSVRARRKDATMIQIHALKKRVDALGNEIYIYSKAIEVMWNAFYAAKVAIDDAKQWRPKSRKR